MQISYRPSQRHGRRQLLEAIKVKRQQGVRWNSQEIGGRSIFLVRPVPFAGHFVCGSFRARHFDSLSSVLFPAGVAFLIPATYQVHDENKANPLKTR